ncbi:helix-turn-helix domain-containing protein [Thiorhodovibrio litoralis]|uniref:helix-turn-helix domain-containing protein n=1 Tax=Thiorhodovibrio litoralis TaxID=2952932 RepID=UPI002B25ACE5|nr:helix-turn-helix domain-containing protein [Thiorhodovibrio litoralis]WPL11226.1 transcriptional regulator EutR [Thiorhodovibrio litoralis]
MRLDQAELLRELALLNEPLAERLAGEGNLTGLGHTAKAPLERSLRALLALARDLDRDLRGPQPDGFSQTLREYLLLAVSHSDPDGGSGPNLHARRRSLRIVRRAQACMDAQASQGDVPRVSDLCAAAGVSERTLQHAFREQLGLAPGAYLRMRRLNGARAELLAPTASTRTITEVAARWGFLHMGRFTRAYRDLFGELPSTTLARSLSN